MLQVDATPCPAPQEIIALAQTYLMNHPQSPWDKAHMVGALDTVTEEWERDWPAEGLC